MAKIPTKHIIDIKELHAADHVIITKKRWEILPYEHHGIVMSVDLNQGTFNMLHYKKLGLFSSIEMVNGVVHFEEAKEKGIFVVQYGKGECLDDQTVLERAEKCIGRNDFNLLNQTSKHIALHCKVGSNPVSIQTENPEGYAEISTNDQTEANLAATSLPRIDLEIPRKRIESIDELCPADHIFIKQWGKEHHGIVMSVDEGHREFEILHYRNLSKEDAKKTKEYLAERSAKVSGVDPPIIEEDILQGMMVLKESMSFDDASNMGLTRIEYEDFDCLTQDIVLERAEDCIGLRGYHRIKQTSEQIAYFCKIGHPITCVPMNFEEISDDTSSFDQPRVSVTSIHQLAPGDHVVYDRGPYGHHGIIVEVFPKESKYEVIHYTTHIEGDGSKAALNFFNLNSKAIIKQQTLTFDEKKDVGIMFVVLYEKEGCRPPEEVIAEAKKFVGKENYNLLLRNCECMALYCKTGIGKSEQVRRFFSNLGEQGSNVANKVLPAVLGGLSDDIAFALTRVSMAAPRALGAGMAAAGGGLEVVMAGIDIFLYERQRKKARLPEKKYHAKVVTRPIAAATTIGGGAAGVAIGAPLGPPGMIVGGLVGGFAGAILPRGVLFGVEKAGYLEEPIYDTTKRRDAE